MNLLILGGTAFLGRAIAGCARDAGWSVACLARGSAPEPEGVRFVRADRDDRDGLADVRAQLWDAVVDVSRQPGQVRRAVAELQAEHWVFVSSGNVYARFDRAEQDESAAVLEPLTGDVMEDMSVYGPAKVACEQAVRAAARQAGASATIVRAGLIGGFGDWSGRTGYYPWRFAHPTGADVLVPGDPEFPCALIDVDDLAARIVLGARERVDGTFNATGPTVSLEDVLAVARNVAGADAPPPRWVPAEALATAGVSAWMGPASLPLWIDDPAWRWFATLDCGAARAAGLTTRPLEETLASALAFEEIRDVPRQTGLTDDEERELRHKHNM